MLQFQQNNIHLQKDYQKFNPTEDLKPYQYLNGFNNLIRYYKLQDDKGKKIKKYLKTWKQPLYHFTEMKIPKYFAEDIQEDSSLKNIKQSKIMLEQGGQTMKNFDQFNKQLKFQQHQKMIENISEIFEKNKVTDLQIKKNFNNHRKVYSITRFQNMHTRKELDDDDFFLNIHSKKNYATNKILNTVAANNKDGGQKIIEELKRRQNIFKEQISKQKKIVSKTQQDFNKISPILSPKQKSQFNYNVKFQFRTQNYFKSKQFKPPIQPNELNKKQIIKEKKSIKIQLPSQKSQIYKQSKTIHDNQQLFDEQKKELINFRQNDYKNYFEEQLNQIEVQDGYEHPLYRSNAFQHKSPKLELPPDNIFNYNQYFGKRYQTSKGFSMQLSPQSKELLSRFKDRIKISVDKL